MTNLPFMPGERVRYVGNKFSAEIGNKIGEIDAKIFGSNAYSVTFINGYRETGDVDRVSYIVTDESLLRIK